MDDYFANTMNTRCALLREIEEEIANNPVAFAAEISKMYPKYVTASYMSRYSSWCKGPDAASDIICKINGFIKTREVATALENAGFARVAGELRTSVQTGN